MDSRFDFAAPTAPIIVAPDYPAGFVGTTDYVMPPAGQEYGPVVVSIPDVPGFPFTITAGN